MSTFAIVSNLITDTFHLEKPSLAESVNVRLTSFVFPSDTLVVKMKKESNKIIYSATTKERGIEVCKGTYMMR